MEYNDAEYNNFKVYAASTPYGEDEELTPTVLNATSSKHELEFVFPSNCHYFTIKGVGDNAEKVRFVDSEFTIKCNYANVWTKVDMY